MNPFLHKVTINSAGIKDSRALMAEGGCCDGYTGFIQIGGPDPAEVSASRKLWLQIDKWDMGEPATKARVMPHHIAQIINFGRGTVNNEKILVADRGGSRAASAVAILKHAVGISDKRCVRGYTEFNRAMLRYCDDVEGTQLEHNAFKGKK